MKNLIDNLFLIPRRARAQQQQRKVKLPKVKIMTALAIR